MCDGERNSEVPDSNVEQLNLLLMLLDLGLLQVAMSLRSLTVWVVDDVDHLDGLFI